MELTIKSERVELTVSSFGAEMRHLKLDGFEYLWCGDEKFYGRVSPCLFPITGRFMDGYYTHDGKQYPMQLNGIAMEKHFKMELLNDSQIKCTLNEDEETLQVYPYKFQLEILYTLKNNLLDITYTVTNNSDDILPYSVGNHTAYKWPLVDGQDPNSYFFRFEKNETLRSFNPFGWTADFLINENIRPIHHSFYENFTRSIRDPKSEWLEYTGANCDYVVRTYRKNFPFIANWARPEADANLVCIEPCISISSHGPDIFDREGIRSLDPHTSENVSYQLLLYKKSEQ